MTIVRRAMLVTMVLLLCANACALDLIKIATSEYPPYMGQDLPQGGMLVAVATEAFRRSGYELKVTFLPWARTMDSAKSGALEGVLGIWHSDEREQWFVYSKPLPGTEVGFYKRSDSQISYRSLSELKPYTIGTVRGYANPSAFNAANLRIDEVVDDETNLRKLGAGRIDLALIDKGVARYLIASKPDNFKGKLVWIEPAVEKQPLYIALSKKTADLDKKLAAFNKGLQSMEKDGTLTKMVKEAGM